MKIKYLVRFLNRAAQFDTDLELLDGFDKALKNGMLTSDSNRIVDYADPKEHPLLSKRKVSDHNLNITMSHFTVTLRSAFIKDIYESILY